MSGEKPAGRTGTAAPVGHRVRFSHLRYDARLMRAVRIIVYCVVASIGMVALFLAALSTRMTGREDSDGHLPTIGWTLLALAATAGLYEWAFWQRARRKRRRAAALSSQSGEHLR